MYPIVSKAVMDFHSIEDIVEHRTRILSRFKDLKNAMHIKTEKLQEVKKFRYFEREMEEFMLLLNDLFDAVPEEHLEDLANLQAKVCKHEDIDSELRARETERDVLEQLGLQMIADNHSESENIRKKICDMKEKWQSLSSKLIDQIEILRTKQHFIEFGRNYDKFVECMKEKVKFISEKLHFTSLESIEKYIYEFTQMEKKVFRMEVEVEELRAAADFFIKDDYPQSYNVSQKKENLNFCWRTLKGLVQTKKTEVSELIRLYKLSCRADEFLAWIARKKEILSNDDYGEDLADILVLQGKNDGIVRILEQLELRFQDIMLEHDCLNPLHSEFTTDVLVEKNIIQQNWLELKNIVKERRRNLKDRYKIYKLNSDIDNNIAWINELKSVLSIEDISERVADGEATLSMLNIYSNVINSRKEIIDEIFRTGGGLLLVYCEHFNEINGKLSALYRAKQSLQDLFESQQKKYQLRMELQLFHRDYDLAKNWLKQKEVFLHLDDDQLNSLDTIQELIEQQKEFGITFDSEVKRIAFLVDNTSLTTINSENVDRKDQKKAQLWERLTSFRSQLEKRFQLLKDALKLQLFYSDCEDVERWIIDKVKIINNESYLDESRISANIASNWLFVNELSDYCNTIISIKAREQELSQENHFGLDDIRNRVKGIIESWIPLVRNTEEKITKLDGVLDARCFLLISSKIELNLTEYEERVQQQYVYHDGKSLTKMNGERNLESILREVKVFQRSLHKMKAIGLELIHSSHYDAENIAKKIKVSSERYMNLTSTIEEKQKNVIDARKASELLMDMEEQINWMKEKIVSLSVMKIDLGLLDIKHLLVKHETNTATMNSRTIGMVRLRDTAHQMISDNHFDSVEIRKRLTCLLDTWYQMNQQNEQFLQKLEESERIYDFFAEAELSESFMQEKKLFFSNTDLGENEDSSAALLKRHQVIAGDLKAYKKNITDLRIKAETCKKVSGEIGHGPIKTSPVLRRQDELEKLYEDLMNVAEERSTKLENTHEAYVLLRECADMLSWIAVKTIYAEEENVGENLAELEVLQKKFEDFQSDLAERKIKLIVISTKIDELVPQIDAESAKLLSGKTEQMKTQMKRLQELTNRRNTQLNSAHELRKFLRDVDDIEYWIKEKHTHLDSVDHLGYGLKKIRTLLRKHEGLERDLDALKETIDGLNENATRLTVKYADAAYETINKRNGLNEKWKELIKKATLVKEKLLDCYDLQKFFTDHDHLMSRIRKMITAMNSIECTSDIHGAEILESNFQGLVVEVESYATEVKTINKFGEMLVTSNHTISNEIGEKLKELKLAHELLEDSKLSRKILLDQNMEVNIFLKACEDVEIWVAHKKALLSFEWENDELVKIHRILGQSISRKQKDIISLQELANKMITVCYLHNSKIAKRCDEVIMEWQSLKDAHITMCSKLKESQSLQQFSLEAAEIEYWVDERLLQATQESHRDPVNIRSKLLKHQVFVAEISINASRVQTVLENGHRLVESIQSENLKSAVLERLENISSQWKILMGKTNEKSEKLKEVSKQYDHIIAIKYMNFWMGDVETKLLNQDIGKDLNAVQNLLGQHKVIEEDIEAHWHKIRNLENETNIFIAGDSIFDIVSIKDEHNNMISRYLRIKNLAAQRQRRLYDKNAAFVLFKEIEDREMWMRQIATRMELDGQPKFKCDR